MVGFRPWLPCVSVEHTDVFFSPGLFPSFLWKWEEYTHDFRFPDLQNSSKHHNMSLNVFPERWVKHLLDPSVIRPNIYTYTHVYMVLPRLITMFRSDIPRRRSFPRTWKEPFLSLSTKDRDDKQCLTQGQWGGKRAKPLSDFKMLEQLTCRRCEN